MGRVSNEVRAWVEGLAGAIPGAVGYRLRRAWHRKTFAALGTEAVLGPGLLVHGAPYVSIGNDFTCWRNCTLAAFDAGHVWIGNRVSLNANVYINARSGGPITVGDDVLIGPNVVLRSGDHVFDSRERPIREQGHRARPIEIADDVWIAANVTVVGGVRIGRGAVVAANAVVTADVEPYAIVGGVPAKVLGRRPGP